MRPFIPVSRIFHAQTTEGLGREQRPASRRPASMRSDRGRSTSLHNCRNTSRCADRTARNPHFGRSGRAKPPPRSRQSTPPYCYIRLLIIHARLRPVHAIGRTFHPCEHGTPDLRSDGRSVCRDDPRSGAIVARITAGRAGDRLLQTQVRRNRGHGRLRWDLAQAPRSDLHHERLGRGHEGGARQGRSDH